MSRQIKLSNLLWCLCRCNCVTLLTLYWSWKNSRYLKENQKASEGWTQVHGWKTHIRNSSYKKYPTQEDDKMPKKLPAYWNFEAQKRPSIRNVSSPFKLNFSLPNISRSYALLFLALMDWNVTVCQEATVWKPLTNCCVTLGNWKEAQHSWTLHNASSCNKVLTKKPVTKPQKPFWNISIFIFSNLYMFVTLSFFHSIKLLKSVFLTFIIKTVRQCQTAQKIEL